MTAIGQTFVVIVWLTLVEQLCGVAYEMAVAARFGTGLDADAIALSLVVVLGVTNELMTWVSTPVGVGARLSAPLDQLVAPLKRRGSRSLSRDRPASIYARAVTPPTCGSGGRSG